MDKLNVLFLGRFKGKSSKRKMTGMSVASQLIHKMLVDAECNVTALPASNKAAYLDKIYDVDLVWFYEDTILREELITEIAIKYGPKIPVVFSSMYTFKEDRKLFLLEQLKSSPRNVYLGVFTQEARNSFGEDKDRVLAIPKTIRDTPVENRKYESRSGLMLGEFNKLMNPDHTSRLDIYNLVYRLKTEFSDVKLLAYKHYNIQEGHRLSTRRVNTLNNNEQMDYIEKNVEIIEYTPDLISKIGESRLYLSLVTTETFAMVPCEVQSGGTPVLYRDMPQSLSPHLYFSAYMWDSIDDLIEAIKLLYFNSAAWESVSKKGLHNYHAHNSVGLQYILRLQLEKLVVNHKSTLIK